MAARPGPLTPAERQRLREAVDKARRQRVRRAGLPRSDELAAEAERKRAAREAQAGRGGVKTRLRPGES